VTVYEATTMRDYKKIADFLMTEPEDSIVHLCWKRIGLLSAREIKELKDKEPNLHIYYVTDEEDRMKGVFAHGEYGQFAREGCAFMSQEDWDNQVFDFWKELFTFLFEKNVRDGLKIGQIQVAKWVGDRVIQWLGKDLIKIKEIREAPKIGTYYVIEADIEALLRKVTCCLFYKFQRNTTETFGITILHTRRMILT